MLCIRSPEPINILTASLYPLINISSKPNFSAWCAVPFIVYPGLPTSLHWALFWMRLLSGHLEQLVTFSTFLFMLRPKPGCLFLCCKNWYPSGLNLGITYSNFYFPFLILDGTGVFFFCFHSSLCQPLFQHYDLPYSAVVAVLDSILPCFSLFHLCLSPCLLYTHKLRLPGEGRGRIFVIYTS